MLRKFAFLVPLMLFGFGAQASAATIIDTIQGHAFTCCGGWTVADNATVHQSVALPFSSASAVTITNITAYVGGDAGSVEFGIMSDSSALPSGTFLFHQTIALSNVPIVLSSLNWSILGGTQYWLAAIALPGASGAWQFSPTLTGLGAFQTGGPWAPLNSNTPEALISSNDTVPLPGALPLFVSGLGALGLLARCRKRKTAAA